MIRTLKEWYLKGSLQKVAEHILQDEQAIISTTF